MSDHSITKEQPGRIESPSPRTPSNSGFRTTATRLGRKITTKEGWFGGYDYAWLCMPTLPFAIGGRKKRTMPPFYALDSDLPLLLSLACGLQHALAMLAGLITPPIIFASALSLDSETSAYMISASLIGCGMTFPGFWPGLVLNTLSGQASSVWSKCLGCTCSEIIILGPALLA